jgi:hypothetical protein
MEQVGNNWREQVGNNWGDAASSQGSNVLDQVL